MNKILVSIIITGLLGWGCTRKEDVVAYVGRTYKCIQAGTGNTPALSTAFWTDTTLVSQSSTTTHTVVVADQGNEVRITDTLTIPTGLPVGFFATYFNASGSTIAISSSTNFVSA